jgi:tetratricopeptide (TPR) repeat protein
VVLRLLPADQPPEPPRGPRGPAGYHATAWILHALACVAVFLLARAFLDPWGASLAASLFAVWPVQAEAVGWISARTDILALLFAALAASLWVRGEEFAPGRRKTAGPSRFVLFAGLASCSFLLALLSKESAIALALVMGITAWLAGLRGRRAAGLALGLAIPVGAAVLLRIWLNPGASLASGPGGIGLPSSPTRALLALLYLPRRLALPVLGRLYLPEPRWLPLDTLLTVALAAGGLLLAVAAWRSGRRGIVFALIWIASSVLTVAAAAAWNVTRTPVADRNLSWGAAGAGLRLASLLAAWAGGGAGKRRAFPAIAGWGLVVLLAIATSLRLPVYAGDLAFWTEVQRRDPADPVALLNLGNALASEGRFPEAEAAYRKAAALPMREADRALLLTATGTLLDLAGRPEEADAPFREAARLPRAGAIETYSAGLHFLRRAELARARGMTGPAAEAAGISRAALLRAVRIDPRVPEAWLRLGDAESVLGNADGAAAAWRRVLELDGPGGSAASEARRSLDALRAGSSSASRE